MKINLLVNVLSKKMKIRLYLFFLIIFKTIPAFEQINANYTLEIDINPSIGFEKKWTLQKELGKCKLDGDEYITQENDSLLSQYFSQLDSILANLKFSCYESMYYKGNGIYAIACDGTNVSGKVILVDTILEFGFHNGNPNIDLSHFNCIDVFNNIIFYLYYQTSFKPNITINNYDTLTKIEQYSTPHIFRLVSQNPLIYRFYGRTEYKDFKPTLDLFNTLPKIKPVLIELGEYYKISKNEDYYPLLKLAVKSSQKNIFWLASDKLKKELIALGVRKRNILANRDEFIEKLVLTNNITNAGLFASLMRSLR